MNKRYIDAEDIFVRICSTDDIEWRSRARSGLAYIPMYQGKFIRTLEILDKGIGGDELDRYSGLHCSQKHFLKALILSEINEAELAFEEIELAIEIYRRSFPNKRNAWLVYYPALLAENNDFIKAGEMAEAARKELEEKDPHNMLLYWHALGCIEHYKGNLDAAELYFEKALEVYGYLRFEFRYMMGLTYLKEGKIEEAINEFNTRVIKYPGAELAWWSIREVKSYYYLGIAYERSGWTNKAIENYEEFLDIWKEADPGIEEIEDARARLARLKQEI
jgi:tetratricopeptide (TPR) repeat protein